MDINTDSVSDLIDFLSKRTEELYEEADALSRFDTRKYILRAIAAKNRQSMMRLIDSSTRAKVLYSLYRQG